MNRKVCVWVQWTAQMENKMTELWQENEWLYNTKLKNHHNQPNWKQCKLLVVVHVCFGPRTHWGFAPELHYWFVVQCVVLLLPDCCKLNKNQSELGETIRICGLSSVCRFQLIFGIVHIFSVFNNNCKLACNSLYCNFCNFLCCCVPRFLHGCPF